jgi:sialic acid synthase SpsE
MENNKMKNSKTTINLAGHEISQSSAPFIIAEAGINHNGDLSLAKKMVDVAKSSGCHAVKFQTFTAKEFCGDPEQIFTYQSQGKEVSEPMLQMFERHEFTKEQWHALKAYCQQQDICFLSTPQNPSDLGLLMEIGVDAIKIGSDDFTNLPLIAEYAKTGLPIILSCGMADLAEVYKALETLGALSDHAYPCVLCLCTSQYPTPAEDINLNKLTTLNGAFPHIIKGFSDHSQGPLASSLAVAFGARVFEKHFTLDHSLSGPDHWFSEDTVGIKLWVDSINTAYSMLGNGQITPTEKEQAMRTLARRSVVALKDIESGDKLTKENIGLRRPGNGLPPIFFEQVLEKVASKKINAASCIALGDFTHDIT